MNFVDAREELHSGRKIRHESMPEGEWIMKYCRGFGTDMLIIVDTDENLSGAPLDFGKLFWATLTEDEDGWEVCV